MESFPCPYLGGTVELTAEREQHIKEEHPNLLPQFRHRIAEVLADPDQVNRSKTLENTLLFAKFYDVPSRARYAVIIVVSDSAPVERNWIVTGYMARKLPKGAVEWTKN